jgi:hypothetical protein
VKQKIFPFIALLMLFGCKVKQNSPGPAKKPEPAANTTGATIQNYDRCKKKVAAARFDYAQKWPAMSMVDKQKAFTTTVAEVILPQWMGTPWNFYGTTEIPGQGTIACGYFVTTTLRDAGVGLARIKLAQCASEQMIRTLVQAKYIQRFSNVPMEQFLKAIRQQGYGLYITGLDSHTGFLYNDGTEIYFIHSNYTGTRCVIKEKAATSLVLTASKYKVTGKISADEKVLEGWVKD